MMMMIFHRHPPPLEERSTCKEWRKPEPVEPNYPYESTLLQTVNQLITKYGNDPHYRVKSEKSPSFGYSMEDLKKVRDGIAAKRKATQPLSKQLEEGRQRLVTPRAKPTKERPPPTPFVKAVMSRRSAIEITDDEDDFPE